MSGRKAAVSECEYWEKLISPGAGGNPAPFGNDAEPGHNGVNPGMSA
ncbi:hypothetical protein [Nocardia sp. NPDC002869]